MLTLRRALCRTSDHSEPGGTIRQYWFATNTITNLHLIYFFCEVARFSVQGQIYLQRLLGVPGDQGVMEPGSQGTGEPGNQ